MRQLRSRLKERGLLELLPRVRGRATCRGFLIGAEQLVDALASTTGARWRNAARLLEWPLPEARGRSKPT